MLGAHLLQLVLQGNIAVACDQAHMRKGPHLSLSLATTSTLFVAFQKVAERMIIQSLLLFNGHNVLQRLLEFLQMQIKISLVLRECGHFFVKDGDVALIKVLKNKS